MSALVQCAMFGGEKCASTVEVGGVCLGSDRLSVVRSTKLDSIVSEKF